MALYVIIHVVMWSIFLFYLISTIFAIVECTPRERIWNLLITEGHCFNANAGIIATGIFNSVSDLVILSIPTIPIWNLQMPLKKKLLVTAIFAAGIL